MPPKTGALVEVAGDNIYVCNKYIVVRQGSSAIGQHQGVNQRKFFTIPKWDLFPKSLPFLSTVTDYAKLGKLSYI